MIIRDEISPSISFQREMLGDIKEKGGLTASGVVSIYSGRPLTLWELFDEHALTLAILEERDQNDQSRK